MNLSVLTLAKSQGLRVISAPRIPDAYDRNLRPHFSAASVSDFAR